MNEDKPAARNNPEDRAHGWWRELTGGPDGKKADRAALANLRRCRRPVDALMVPATFSLLRRLPRPPWLTSDRYWQDRVAALAVVLAHIREDTAKTTVARAIGRSSFSEADTADLSEGRFRRLLQSEGADELLTNMVRLVRFMKGTANVCDLSAAILYWGDETRRRWTFDYYAVRIAAPNDSRSGQSVS